MNDEPTGDGLRRPHPLTTDVLRLVARVRAAAVEDEAVVVVESLDAELARTRRGAADVVVVGEKKRGKSSLVNALVGWPRLLPVDADIASCVHIVVRYEDTPSVRVYDADATAGRGVAVEELAEYAALDPSTDEPRRPDVARVEVGVPAPLLGRGLEVVDTPGVGGLVAGHAALTLATLERADALLFVLDGQSEITASELAFLERASDRIATVVFVVTKIDMYHQWQAVVARDLELVGAHAPRYAAAPWFPVSTRLDEQADRAEDAGRPEVAARRRTDGGVRELEAYLGLVAESAEGLRLANLVHQAEQGAKRLAGIRVRRGQSLSLDPDFAVRITSEKAALTRLQSRQATWRQSLSEQTARVEQRLRTELARRIEDLRKTTGDRIATGGASVFDEVASDLPARAMAIWTELDTLMRQELPTLVEAVTGDLVPSGVDVLGALTGPSDRLVRMPQASRAKAATNLLEHGIMAAGLGSMTVTLAAAVSLATPIGLLAGAAIVGVFAHRRHQRDKGTREREDARRYLAEITARLQTEVPPALSQALIATKDAVAAQVSEALATERARVTAGLAEHEKNLATEKVVLQKRKAASDEGLRERNEMRQSAVELATRLRVDGGGS